MTYPVSINTLILGMFNALYLMLCPSSLLWPLLWQPSVYRCILRDITLFQPCETSDISCSTILDIYIIKNVKELTPSEVIGLKLLSKYWHLSCFEGKVWGAFYRSPRSPQWDWTLHAQSSNQPQTRRMKLAFLAFPLLPLDPPLSSSEVTI